MLTIKTETPVAKTWTETKADSKTRFASLQKVAQYLVGWRKRLHILEAFTLKIRNKFHEEYLFKTQMETEVVKTKPRIANCFKENIVKFG